MRHEKPSDTYRAALKRLANVKRQMAQADEKRKFFAELLAIEALDPNGPVGVECRRIVRAHA